MNKNKNLILGIIGTLLIFLMVQTPICFAQKKSSPRTSEKKVKSVKQKSVKVKTAKGQKRFGSVVSKVPRGYKTVPVGKKNYYHRDGRFLKRSSRGYVVVPGPKGATTKKLHRNRIKIMVGHSPYYYYYGTYYKLDPARRRYRVVMAPVGAIVPMLPPGFTIAYHHGVKLYVVGGVHYRPVYHDDMVEYEVVEYPNDDDDDEYVEDEVIEQDTIFLYDGGVIKGRYIGGDENTIVFEAYGEIFEFSIEEIESMSFETPLSPDQEESAPYTED